MSNKINNITVTLVFDGSALNRDEKIGNSILSIKKLTYHGDIRPYISKNAIRHYLFNTLNRYNNWGKTPIIAQGSGDKQTLQLDLSKADILSFEELAVFGYMFTKSGESALTRKSTIGITKAIALSSYNQDLSFYANHDFVNRVRETGRNANPNPVNKEEHSGLFKLSFTIDADMLGKDSWVVDDFSFNEGTLNIKIAEPQKFVIGNVKKNINENGEEIGYKIVDGEKSYPLEISGLGITLPKEVVKYDKNQILTLNPDIAADRKEKTAKNSKISFATDYKFKISEAIENDDEKGITYFFECTYEPKIFESNSEGNKDASEEDKVFNVELLSGFEKRIENVECSEYKKANNKNIFELSGDDYAGCKIEITSFNESKPENGPFKIQFSLSEKKKKEIISQLLFVIKNGIVAQSSNELNTIKPLFILAADVKVPMPIFHGDIDVKKDGDKLKVIGVKDAVDNGWIESKMYYHCSERLDAPVIINEKIETNWDKFLKAVLPENDESTQN